MSEIKKTNDRLKGFVRRNLGRVAAFGILSSAPLSAAAVETDGLNDKKANEAENLINLRKTLQSLPASGVYKGLSIDYASLRARDIGHIYESGMNPTITDSSKPIETASYIGLYQMSLREGDTMSGFIKAYGSRFPELRGKNLHRKDFQQAYVRYATGSRAKEFDECQFEYMWEHRYRPVFEKLAELPGMPRITTENCDNDEYKVFAGAVMSCVNQSPRLTLPIFVEAYEACARRYGKVNEDNQTAFLGDLTQTSYDIRSRKWPKVASRYTSKRDGEKKLCLEAHEFCKARSDFNRLQKKRRVAALSPQAVPVKAQPAPLKQMLLNQRFRGY